MSCGDLADGAELWTKGHIITLSAVRTPTRMELESYLVTLNDLKIINILHMNSIIIIKSISGTTTGPTVNTGKG